MHLLSTPALLRAASLRSLLLFGPVFATSTALLSKEFLFSDPASWGRVFTPKIQEGSFEVRDDGVGGAAVLTSPRFATGFHLMGREGARPSTLAHATEVDFRLQGTGSLCLFLRGRVDASDSYAVMVKRTSRGYGELQVYRAPIWPAADLSAIVPLSTQKIDQLSDTAWYRLKLVIKDQVDSVSIGATLLELAPGHGDERFTEGVSVVSLEAIDNANPLVWPGLLGLRLYVNNETTPPSSFVHVRRISVTPDPAVR